MIYSGIFSLHYKYVARSSFFKNSCYLIWQRCLYIAIDEIVEDKLTTGLYGCRLFNCKLSFYVKFQKQPSAAMEECEICLKRVPCSSMAALACDHRFCTDCWNYYLTTKIMEEGIGQTISCAAHGCDILVDDQTVMRLITDQKVCTCKMPKLPKTLILVSEAGGTLVNNIIIW